MLFTASRVVGRNTRRLFVPHDVMFENSERKRELCHTWVDFSGEYNMILKKMSLCVYLLAEIDYNKRYEFNMKSTVVI